MGGDNHPKVGVEFGFWNCSNLPRNIQYLFFSQSVDLMQSIFDLYILCPHTHASDDAYVCNHQLAGVFNKVHRVIEYMLRKQITVFFFLSLQVL